MNPAFVILVLVLVAAIWFLAAGAFKLIGRFIYRIGKDAKDVMSEEENNNG